MNKSVYELAGHNVHELLPSPNHFIKHITLMVNMKRKNKCKNATVNEIPAKEKENVCYTSWKSYVAKILYASVESIRQLNGYKVFVCTSLLQYINQKWPQQQ